MEEKKRNRNALRSIRMIVEAYIELIDELPMEKVTVTKIVERADINRSTFYAHFSCPQDVLESIQNEAIENMLKIIQDVPLDRFLKDPLPLLQKIADFITEREEYYKIIVQHRGSIGFLEDLKEVLVARMMEDKETIRNAKNPRMLQANLRFFAGGYISLFQDWITGNLDMKLEEITEMTANTISAGVSTFL